MLVAALVLLFLYGAVGMLLAACLADPPTGPGYWRLVSILIFTGLAFGLGLRLGGWVPGLEVPGSAQVVAFALAAALWIGAVTAKAVSAQRTGSILLAAAGLAGLGGWVQDSTLYPPLPGAFESTVYWLGLTSAGMALGTVLLAMVLAHWYLIEPRLPVAPLNRVLALFLGLEILKVVLLIAVVAIHLPGWNAAPGGLLRALVLGDALFVAVRAVLGIAAPLALAWLTWKTVQIRSIQSATGILYAAIVFVLFGEVISLILSLSTGQPF